MFKRQRRGRPVNSVAGRSTSPGPAAPISDGGFAPRRCGTAGGEHHLADAVAIDAGATLDVVATNLMDLDAGTGGTGAGVHLRRPAPIRVYGAGTAELLVDGNNTYTGGTTVTAGSTAW